MSVERVGYHAGVVLRQLHENRHHAPAARLERLVEDALRPGRAEQALAAIVEQCQAPALSDLSIDTLTGPEWLAALVRLRGACERELARRAATGDRGGAGFDRHRAFEEASAFARSIVRDEGPDDGNALLRAGLAVLSLVLLTAMAMIIGRLPDPRPSAAVEVSGVYLRSEPAGRRRPHALRGRIYLDGHAVAYGVWDASGFGWSRTMRAVAKGDRIRLLVDAAAYRREEARHAHLSDELRAAYSVDGAGRLAARSVTARQRHPVPVLEIRVGERVTFCKTRLLPEDRGALLLWGGAALATLLLIAGMLLLERRKRGARPAPAG